MRVVENAVSRRHRGRYQRAAAVYQTFIGRGRRRHEREREIRPGLDITKIVCREKFNSETNSLFSYIRNHYYLPRTYTIRCLQPH